MRQDDDGHVLIVAQIEERIEPRHDVGLVKQRETRGDDRVAHDQAWRALDASQEGVPRHHKKRQTARRSRRRPRPAAATAPSTCAAPARARGPRCHRRETAGAVDGNGPVVGLAVAPRRAAGAGGHESKTEGSRGGKKKGATGAKAKRERERENPKLSFPSRVDDGRKEEEEEEKSIQVLQATHACVRAVGQIKDGVCVPVDGVARVCRR